MLSSPHTYRMLCWRILLASLLGLAVGFGAAVLGSEWLVTDWIAPIGQLFARLLALLAVPLVLVLLLVGVAAPERGRAWFRQHGAVGLLYASALLLVAGAGLLATPPRATSMAAASTWQAPLQLIAELVPDNLIATAANNGQPLQVALVAVLFGFGFRLVSSEKAQPLLDFFDGLGEVLAQVAAVALRLAPAGFFALLADVGSTLPFALSD